MARREVTQYFDDLDGTELQEDDVRSISFSVEGKYYVLDVSENNRAVFYDAISRFMEKGRQVQPPYTVNKKTYGSATRNPDTRKIRQWALDHGKEVSNRGRIPFDIVDAYYQAHEGKK